MRSLLYLRDARWAVRSHLEGADVAHHAWRACARRGQDMCELAQARTPTGIYRHEQAGPVCDLSAAHLNQRDLLCCHRAEMALQNWPLRYRTQLDRRSEHCGRILNRHCGALGLPAGVGPRRRTDSADKGDLELSCPGQDS